MKRCRQKRYNFQIRNKMSKEKQTLGKQQTGDDFIADVMHCLLPELNRIDSEEEHKDWYTATLQYRLREAKKQDGNLVIAICNALEDYLK